MSVSSHMLTSAAERWTLQSIGDHDFFRTGCYPLLRSDAFGISTPPTTNFDPVANNRTYRNLCRETGLGAQIGEVGRTRTPRNPLINCAWDVVNPTLWDVQPCILVDA